SIVTCAAARLAADLQESPREDGIQSGVSGGSIVAVLLGRSPLRPRPREAGARRRRRRRAGPVLRDPTGRPQRVGDPGPLPPLPPGFRRRRDRRRAGGLWG